MASGRDVQLARQIGESLAVAELGRRGWIATSFTGSLPGFDLLAVNAEGRFLEVQVKALRSGTWQLNAGQFINVEMNGDEQIVRGPRAIKSAGRICIFIRLREQGADEFYVFSWHQLQQILLSGYKAGKRPKNPTTLHHALRPNDIAQFRDDWRLLES